MIIFVLVEKYLKHNFYGMGREKVNYEFGVAIIIETPSFSQACYLWAQRQRAL